MRADLNGYAPARIEERAECTCREEGWILASELVSAELPPVVQAFRTFNESAWSEFIEQLNPEGLRFFNHESSEWSHAATWRELAKLAGFPIGTGYLKLHEDATDDQKRIMRQVRNLMHYLSDADEFRLGDKVFGIENVHRRIMIVHRSELARSFFLPYGEHYGRVVEELKMLGQHLTNIYCTWSRIDPIN